MSWEVQRESDDSRLYCALYFALGRSYGTCSSREASVAAETLSGSKGQARLTTWDCLGSANPGTRLGLKQPMMLVATLPRSLHQTLLPCDQDLWNQRMRHEVRSVHDRQSMRRTGLPKSHQLRRHQDQVLRGRLTKVRRSMWTQHTQWRS